MVVLSLCEASQARGKILRRLGLNPPRVYSTRYGLVIPIGDHLFGELDDELWDEGYTWHYEYEPPMHEALGEIVIHKLRNRFDVEQLW